MSGKRKDPILTAITAAAVISAVFSSCSKERNVETVSDTSLTQVQTVSETTASSKAAETSASTVKTTAKTIAETTAETTVTENTETSVTEYITEEGLLNDNASAAIENFIAKETEAAYLYTAHFGLYDFTLDGVPEIYAVHHTNGQGTMESFIYTLDGDLYGEFDGYCREGFTRFFTLDGNVYVHNFYEHSAHLSVDKVDRMTESGISEYLLECGAVGNAFPLKEYTYCINGEAAEAADYYDECDKVLRSSFNEANEVSICTYDADSLDMSDYGSQAQWLVDTYNGYFTAKKAAESYLGGELKVFCYYDFDGNGSYEAFFCQKDSPLCFISDNAVTELCEPTFGMFIDFTRIGSLFLAQNYGNTENCVIYGVKDGKPYEHELSGVGMFMRPSPSYGCDNMDLINDQFVLYKSGFDSMGEKGVESSSDGAHTYKPYWFTLSGELTGEPVSREDFAGRSDVEALFDRIEAEGSTVTGAYLRDGCILNINYEFTLEPDSKLYGKRYATYIIQNEIREIECGSGIYHASIFDE